MAFFNSIPKLPSFKFDPSRHKLTPEADYGFKMPDFNMQDYQMPSLPPATPERWEGRTDLARHFGAPPTTPDFGGIEPYTPETKKTTPARAPAYPTTTRTPAFTPGRRTTMEMPRPVPIPYGSQSFWQPEGEMPAMGALPEYMTPEMDRARIGELTELGMGAPMGRLKEGLNKALLEARYSTNPMVRAMARKQAMAGYGGGISDIRTGAHRGAMAEYMPEFQAQIGKSQAEYQARVQKTRDQFQSDIQDYIRKGKQITTPVEGRRGTASTDERYKIKWRV